MHLIKKKKFKKLKNGIEILVGQAVLSYRSGLGKAPDSYSLVLSIYLGKLKPPDKL